MVLHRHVVPFLMVLGVQQSLVKEILSPLSELVFSRILMVVDVNHLLLNMDQSNLMVVLHHTLPLLMIRSLMLHLLTSLLHHKTSILHLLTNIIHLLTNILHLLINILNLLTNTNLNLLSSPQNSILSQLLIQVAVAVSLRTLSL
jgi:hypothetical protein